MENNNSSNLLIVMGAILAVALVIGVINVRNLNTDIEKLTERVDVLEQKVNGTSSSGVGTDNQSYDTSVFKEISISDIVKESKKETIVVWLGLPSCGYCQAFAPLLADVAEEYGIKARYIDVSTMSQEDYDTLITLEGDGKYAGYGATFTGTPFTMFVKNGKVVGGINGYVETDSIRNAFKEAGLKK